MAISEERARQIAAEVSAYITAQQGVRKAAPRLILPESVRDPNALAEAIRQRHERRIYFAVNQCRAPWLIDQALDGAPNIESMPDDALLRLLRDCEKALQCLLEGVSFMDAGLVRAYAD